MKKLRFMTKCPGCQDPHFGVECKKPTMITPTMVRVRCDECESVVLLKVILPKGRTKHNEISFQAVKFSPSEKFLEKLKKEQEAMKPVIPETQTPEVVSESV